MMNKQRWNLKSSGLLLVCCLISFADPGTTLAKKQTVMKQTDFGTGVKTAVSLIEYHDTCVWVQVFFIADQFFKGIHETETSSGPEFSKDKTLIRTFPDHLVVDVEATVSRCTPHPNEIIPPDYASGLMTGASFEAGWKEGAQTRPAPLLFMEERHRPGLRWDYFFQLPSRGVPLSDSLAIDVSLRHGISRTQLEASLKGRVE